MVHSYLGKVFISYSSADRAFVTRLDRRLKRAGYQIWLDRHELVAGDVLSSKIAEGVCDARVVLVVVSAESVKSNWLRYELSLATGRMVKGECRVIPLVIDDTDLPADVLALLYADFRGEFKYGFRGVATALEHENVLANAQASFWRVVRDLVQSEFEWCGSVSLSSEFAEREYETIRIGSADALFHLVAAHGSEVEPLNELWWREFASSMQELTESLFFIVTERPIQFAVTRPGGKDRAVSYREVLTRDGSIYGYAVFAEFNDLARKDWAIAIGAAKRLLIELAADVSRLPDRLMEPRWPTTLAVSIRKGAGARKARRS